MLEIEGKYAKAKVFTDSLENAARGQIQAICDSPLAEGATLRIMPDVHPGKGCVIGATASLAGRVSPAMVGVDIGCGMHCVRLREERLDFNQLNKMIKRNVPIGKGLNKTPHRFAERARLAALTVARAVDNEKARLAIGSLGGGNHFIELARAESDGALWLIIHSGSRNPGLQVATLHQKQAGETRPDGVPFELAWLEGEKLDNYINDMEIMQEFAALNREAIADSIMKAMKWKAEDSFHTIHNYIDVENMILRKGAVSAKKGERLLIPMNMRDGSALCVGKGNGDWNFSAPHGAGRLLSRQQAKERLTLDNFRREMEGVFTSGINHGVIDESPSAYKPMEEILGQLEPTAHVLTMLKPVFNYKAGC